MLEVALYRTLQETMRNVRQHSQAQTASVMLAFDDGDVVTTVCDDGMGLCEEQLTVASRSGHIGVASMRETIEAVGGGFSLVTAPGCGCRVEVRIPVSLNGCLQAR